MQPSAIRWGIGLLALAAAVTAGSWVVAANAEPAKPRPVHTDGKALQQAMVEAYLALFREDAPAARRSMDRMVELTRRLAPEEREVLGRDLLMLDRAYRTTLNGSRESAGKGEIKAAYDEFDWVQRTCRDCHTAARTQGLLPVAGPLWENR